MIEKRLLKYIFPNVLALLGISLYVFADTFFISVCEGSNGLTALNLIMPIFSFIFALASLIGIGSATKFALDRSAGLPDYDKYFSNSIFWTIAVSLIFVVLGATIPAKLLQLLGGDEVVISTGKSYIRTVMCFAPAFMLEFSFNSFVRNDNSPNLAMAATLSSSFFNILFDYVFMFPLKMGLFGAALATGLSPIVSIIICSIHFFSKKNTIKFVWAKPSVKKLFCSCALGFTGFVGELANAITAMVFNFLFLGLIGNIGVAAYSIVANISFICIAIFNGISQGLQPMASKAQGEKREDDKKRILRCSLIVGACFAVIIVVVCCVFASGIVGIFNSEHSLELGALATKGLRLYIIGFLIAFFNLILAGYFSAIDKPKQSFVISTLRGVFAIVIFAFVLSKLFGVTGVWLSFVVAEFVTLVVSIVLLLKQIRAAGVNNIASAGE